MALEKIVKERHVCNPQPKAFFGHITYQCGCGRYFSEKDVEGQIKKYANYQIKLLKTKKS